MASTSVSVTGDKLFKDALSALARQKGVTMASMVRIALDKAYGEELHHIVSFFESDIAHTQQSLSTRNDRKKKAVSE